MFHFVPQQQDGRGRRRYSHQQVMLYGKI